MTEGSSIHGLSNEVDVQQQKKKTRARKTAKSSSFLKAIQGYRSCILRSTLRYHASHGLLETAPVLCLAKGPRCPVSQDSRLQLAWEKSSVQTDSTLPSARIEFHLHGTSPRMTSTSVSMVAAFDNSARHELHEFCNAHPTVGTESTTRTEKRAAWHAGRQCSSPGRKTSARLPSGIRTFTPTGPSGIPIYKNGEIAANYRTSITLSQKKVRPELASHGRALSKAASVGEAERYFQLSW